MKKLKILMLPVVFIGFTVLSGCSDGENQNDISQEASSKEYYCPMQCEGEKTYKENKNCPKCAMKLVEKE